MCQAPSVVCRGWRKPVFAGSHVGGGCSRRPPSRATAPTSGS